jgi:transcriptional regulator with XRE-family HTH domain
MNIADLLDAAKTRNEIASDNQLAKALGVSRQAVSSWRTGLKAPDPVACATLAGLTGEPLAKVLGIAGEARALSREEKAVWRKLAATALLGAILCVIPFGNSHAATGTYEAEFPSLYIMLWKEAAVRGSRNVTYPAGVTPA